MKVLIFVLTAIFVATEANEKLVQGNQLTYNVAVIGGGLFGSATAKYVAKDTEHSILIGPSEDAKTDIGIFGAWFDEGRIAELADSDGTWYTVAKHSIGRFRDIEKESNINFFNENGFMTLVSEGDIEEEDLEKFEGLCDQINDDGHKCIKVNKEYAQEHFPFLKMPKDFAGFHQPDYSGVINPRRLVEAQLTIAKKLGCEILDGHVVHVERLEEAPVYVITASHSDGSGERRIFAEKVIIATGAYVNLNDWLPALLPDERKDEKPDLVLARETAAFLEVSLEEAERIKDFPNLVTHYDYESLEGTYILPPIQYPDGRLYLKLGHLDAFETEIPDEIALEEITNWYQNGTGYPEAVKVLSEFVQKSLMPDLKVESVHGTSCVIAKTPGMLHPYIGELAENLFLVGGGNGFGANGSDEIGRIGAKLATKNEWDSEISREAVAVQWKKRSNAHSCASRL